ncbi:hypothetical protein [Streptomyces sp. NPDC047976]|uniref:hypothetical protein n=1 Tax=Streptomyces sp. NPDC047976 TaxID=3155746 RepID=UPI00343B634C
MADGPCEVLLIGGRSGVGKSAVGWEVSVRLRAARVAHCLVEGDNLDQAHPAPPGDPDRSRLTEANLAALWRNYTALGQRRLIYTNTFSVLDPALITRAMGGTPRVIGVLLTAADATARRRLAVRETGSQYDAHVRRSDLMSRRLEAEAPPWVVRVPTDGRSVADIALDLVALTGWAAGEDGA